MNGESQHNCERPADPLRDEVTGGLLYCRHLDRGTCHCTVREHRPLPCRGYDCRNDKRVWVDFEKKIVNPELDQLFTSAQLQSKRHADGLVVFPIKSERARSGS